MKIEIEKREGYSRRNVDVHVDWAELTTLYRKLSSRPPVKGVILTEYINRRWEEEEWVGARTSQMLDRLSNGYLFHGDIDVSRLPAVAYDRPRPRYTDDSEGEFDYDLYINGETEHFLTKPKRTSHGGIRLKIAYNFATKVNQRIIAEYTKWLGAVIQNLQARGYDLEIEVFSKLTNTYRETAKCHHSIRVSKFGERVMPHDWSALFSPGGYRHFMFLAYMWPQEIHKDLKVVRGMGHTIPSKWDIQWDEKERAITIEIDSRTKVFPLADMTKKFEGLTF